MTKMTQAENNTIQFPVVLGTTSVAGRVNILTQPRASDFLTVREYDWNDTADVQESEWVVISPRRWRAAVAVGAVRFTETLRLFLDWSGFASLARVTRRARFLRGAAFLWWESLVPESWEGEREGTADGDNGEVYMLYFIVSERFLFTAFFWGFVRRAVNPTIDTACCFPPKGTFGPELLWLPITNSVVLLTSGGRSTLALEGATKMHPREGRRYWNEWILWAVRLAVLFVGAQWSEYRCLWVTAAEGAYGSSFFLATGFHGLHVTLGGIYLLYQTIWSNSESSWNSALWGVRQTSATLSVWYWHFVDLVWLVLFMVFYCWVGLALANLLPVLAFLVVRVFPFSRFSRFSRQMRRKRATKKRMGPVTTE